MVPGERDVGNIVMVNLRILGMDTIDSCRLREIRTRIAHDIIAHQRIRIALRFRTRIARDKVGASPDDYARCRTIKEVIPLNGSAVAAVVQLNPAGPQVLKHAVPDHARIRMRQHQRPRHLIGVFRVVQSPQHFRL